MASSTESAGSLMQTATIVRSGAELVAAACVVLTIAGASNVVARWREHAEVSRPIRTDADGNIVLRPIRATISGNVSLYPTDYENQTTGYSYKHGRLVHQERMTRKFGNWTDVDTVVSWNLIVDRSGDYEVRLKYACDESAAGSSLVVEVAGETLQKTVPSTGGWDKYSSLRLGRVRLEEKRVMSLGLHAETITGGEFIHLENVRLRPVLDTRDLFR